MKGGGAQRTERSRQEPSVRALPYPQVTSQSLRSPACHPEVLSAELHVRPVFALEAVVQPCWANWSACSATSEGKWPHANHKFNRLTLVPKLLQRARPALLVFSWSCGQSASTTSISCLGETYVFPTASSLLMGQAYTDHYHIWSCLPGQSPLLLYTPDDSGHSTYPSLEGNQRQRQQEQRTRPEKGGDTAGVKTYGSWWRLHWGEHLEAKRRPT